MRPLRAAAFGIVALLVSGASASAQVSVIPNPRIYQAITFTQGTITANQPAVDITSTWNNAGVTFTGIRENVTDTSSASGSLLIDLRTVAGGSLFSVRKDGFVTAQAGASVGTTALYQWTGQSAIANVSDGTIQFRNNAGTGFTRAIFGTNDNTNTGFSFANSSGTIVFQKGNGSADVNARANAFLSSGTAGLGYTAGAGGVVTQLTSKSTGVTLSTASGQITMNNAALAAGAKVSFVVTDTTVSAVDTPVCAVQSGGTANAYRCAVTAVGAGSFTITVENITGGSLSEAPVIGFNNIRGSAN